MNKTIASLAILKVNWDQRRKDYIENFVPFVATLICKQNYETIETNIVCQDFAREYGLSIPYHAMITILTRVKKRRLITRYKGQFVPEKDRLSEVDFSAAAKDQIAKQGKVIDEFTRFTREKYKLELTREQAEMALISFVQEHDLDVLFLNQQRTTVLPSAKPTRKQKFLLNTFIKHAYEADRDVFNFIVDIALGHILASTLLYREFDKFKGKLRSIHFYFDTGFVMRLLGTDGEERRIANIECSKILRNEGANLYVFSHTYEEIMGILETCLEWIEHPKADPTKASPALRYFLENNYRASDVERVIVNVDAVLGENGISIVEPPDPDQHRAYQIDESKLRHTIIATYREFVPSFLESEREITVQRDIDSISATYRLRKGRTPRSIKQARHVFVTTNSGLAWATRRFELSEGGERFMMPACLTDVLVGTLVWLESPARLCPINEKKILADCSAALQPDKDLLGKYLNEVERLKSQNKIREQEYYFLRTHRIAMNLLEEKTMGDPDSFTDKTAEEVLEEVKGAIRREEEKKYVEEKEKHIKTREELVTTKEDIGLIKAGIEKRAEQISSVIGRISFGVLLVLCICGILAQFSPGFIWQKTWLRVGLIVIVVLFGLFNVATGFNIKGFRDTVKTWIKARIIAYLTPKPSKSPSQAGDSRT